MTTMSINLWNEDTEDYEQHDIPAKWEICDECQGDGGHSRHLGAITQEDRDRDWNCDEWQDYMGGAYDRQCETCNGSGKVLTPAYPNEEPAKTWIEQQIEKAEERRADMRTLYMESGGSMGQW